MTLEWTIIILGIIILVCAISKAVNYKSEITRLKRLLYKISGEAVPNEDAANKDNDSNNYI